MSLVGECDLFATAIDFSVKINSNKMQMKRMFDKLLFGGVWKQHPCLVPYEQLPEVEKVCVGY